MQSSFPTPSAPRPLSESARRVPSPVKAKRRPKTNRRAPVDVSSAYMSDSSGGAFVDPVNDQARLPRPPAARMFAIEEPDTTATEDDPQPLTPSDDGLRRSISRASRETNYPTSPSDPLPNVLHQAPPMGKMTFDKFKDSAKALTRSLSQSTHHTKPSVASLDLSKELPSPEGTTPSPQPSEPSGLLDEDPFRTSSILEREAQLEHMFPRATSPMSQDFSRGKSSFEFDSTLYRPPPPQPMFDRVTAASSQETVQRHSPPASIRSNRSAFRNTLGRFAPKVKPIPASPLISDIPTPPKSPASPKLETPKSALKLAFNRFSSLRKRDTVSAPSPTQVLVETESIQYTPMSNRAPTLPSISPSTESLLTNIPQSLLVLPEPEIPREQAKPVVPSVGFRTSIDFPKSSYFKSVPNAPQSFEPPPKPVPPTPPAPTFRFPTDDELHLPPPPMFIPRKPPPRPLTLTTIASSGAEEEPAQMWAEDGFPPIGHAGGLNQMEPQGWLTQVEPEEQLDDMEPEEERFADMESEDRLAHMDVPSSNTLRQFEIVDPSTFRQTTYTDAPSRGGSWWPYPQTQLDEETIQRINSAFNSEAESLASSRSITPQLLPPVPTRTMVEIGIQASPSPAPSPPPTPPPKPSKVLPAPVVAPIIVSISHDAILHDGDVPESPVEDSPRRSLRLTPPAFLPDSLLYDEDTPESSDEDSPDLQALDLPGLASDGMLHDPDASESHAGDTPTQQTLPLPLGLAPLDMIDSTPQYDSVPASPATNSPLPQMVTLPTILQDQLLHDSPEESEDEGSEPTTRTTSPSPTPESVVFDDRKGSIGSTHEIPVSQHSDDDGSFELRSNDASPNRSFELPPNDDSPRGSFELPPDEDSTTESSEIPSTNESPNETYEFRPVARPTSELLVPPGFQMVPTYHQGYGHAYNDGFNNPYPDLIAALSLHTGSVPQLLEPVSATPSIRAPTPSVRSHTPPHYGEPRVLSGTSYGSGDFLVPEFPGRDHRNPFLTPSNWESLSPRQSIATTSSRVSRRVRSKGSSIRRLSHLPSASSFALRPGLSPPYKTSSFHHPRVVQHVVFQEPQGHLGLNSSSARKRPKSPAPDRPRTPSQSTTDSTTTVATDSTVAMASGVEFPLPPTADTFDRLSVASSHSDDQVSAVIPPEEDMEDMEDMEPEIEAEPFSRRQHRPPPPVPAKRLPVPSRPIPPPPIQRRMSEDSTNDWYILPASIVRPSTWTTIQTLGRRNFLRRNRLGRKGVEGSSAKGLQGGSEHSAVAATPHDRVPTVNAYTLPASRPARKRVSSTLSAFQIFAPVKALSSVYHSLFTPRPPTVARPQSDYIPFPETDPALIDLLPNMDGDPTASEWTRDQDYDYDAFEWFKDRPPKAEPPRPSSPPKAPSAPYIPETSVVDQNEMFCFALSSAPHVVFERSRQFGQLGVLGWCSEFSDMIDDLKTLGFEGNMFTSTRTQALQTCHELLRIDLDIKMQIILMFLSSQVARLRRFLDGETVYSDYPKPDFPIDPSGRFEGYSGYD